MIRVGLFLPFKSDHWHSIERFAGLLTDKTSKTAGHIEITPIRPNEMWKIFGTSFARRILYTGSAAFHQYDVYHIVDQSYSHLGQFLPSTKTMITCHDLEFWRRRDQQNSLLRRWIANSLLGAEQITTPSKMIQSELDELALELNRKKPISSIITNACGDEFSKPTDKEALVKKWNPDQRPLILNLANTLWPRKNFSFLLNLLKVLKKTNPQILLFQVGPSWSAEHKHFISQNDLTFNIKHFENLKTSDIVELYQTADLLLHPSTYEGFGYPLLESVACQTPFLASNIDVFTQLFPNQEGLLPLDTEIWNQKCEEILADKIKRKKILENQTKILSTYSWQNQILAYVKLYETLAKN